METTTKTFKEGESTEVVYEWFVDQLTKHEDEFTIPRDPADWEVWLNKGIQITIKEL